MLLESLKPINQLNNGILRKLISVMKTYDKWTEQFTGSSHPQVTNIWATRTGNYWKTRQWQLQL